MTETEQSFVGHYTFDRGDYAALTKAMMQPAWRLRLKLFCIWLALVAGMLAVVGATGAGFGRALQDLLTLHDVPWWIYAPLGAILALYMLIPQLRWWRAMRQYSWNAIADGTVSLEIGEGGVRISGPGRDSSLAWPLVRKLLVRDNHLFLAISRREAIVVPRRAFANDFEFAAVMALARRKVPAVQAK